MKKIFFKEFKKQDDYTVIYDSNLINKVLSKLWRFSFEYIFHPRYKYYKPSPWQWIYEEFQLEGMYSLEYSNFLRLKFGQVAAMTGEMYYDKLKEKKLNEPLTIIAVLGSFTKFYNRKDK